FNAPDPQQQQTHKQVTTADSVKATSPQMSANTLTSMGDSLSLISNSAAVMKLGKYFAPFASGSEKIFTVETDVFKAEFTSKGGMLKRWELKEYTTWDKKNPVQLVSDSRIGDLSLLFTTTEGKIINSSALYFSQQSTFSSKVISSGEEFSLEYFLPVTETGKLVRRYIFKSGEYGFRTEQEFVELQNVISDEKFQLAWERGIHYSEHNSVDESNNAKANGFSGGELTEIDASSEGENPKSNFSGTTDWVGTHTKYFGVALIPMQQKTVGGFLEGKHISAANQGVMEKYTVALKLPFKGTREEKSSVTIFLGPLKRSVLQSYNVELDKMLSLGWTWLVRPISEYFILPLFNGLHALVPNYGVVLIIFAFIIKLLLHPLSKKSMHSMKKMQQLQPMILELKEKYKDDPTKLNQATMRLYSDYGVNPAGGCLPLVLQMPILFALFAVFSSTIDLRHAEFFGWIKDLSAPDVLFTLPFAIPIFNIQNVSGLAFMMGITMFVQQKQTVTDPRQKMMVWMMPVMMTLLFNSFPAGLNLYYFLFNILSIAQQWYINKQHSNEPLKKVEQKDRKPSWAERMMKQAESASKGKRK
ncbi:MAG: membrane protein insertase YidC, partial [Bacteroidota bacterium]